MEKKETAKLYQMIIHTINGLKTLNIPNFNPKIIIKYANDIIYRNNYINEEYKNKYIQSIYENNEIYDLFKSSSFSSEIETEEKRNSLIKSKNQRIDEINKEILNAKIEGVNKYKENENNHIPKIHFINTNKKENKNTYIFQTQKINTERKNAIQNYENIANDISSLNEQKQYKFNHYIESSEEKNTKDKLEFEKYLKERIEFLENLLKNEIDKLNKDITEQELIIADKTIISNNKITNLSNDYKKRLKYGYIPYDIEESKLQEKDQDEHKMYSIIEEQILNEFKTKLQENDTEIENLRKERNQFETEYKTNLRQLKRERNSFLRKTINDINKEISQKNKIYSETKAKSDKQEIKKLIILKQNETKKIQKETDRQILELKQEYISGEVKYIEKFEKLRTKKSIYETSKSNAMKNLNHERTFFQIENTQKIKQILEEKDSFTLTDKLDENINISRLRLERDIEKANINKEISILLLNINSKKYQHKYLVNKAIADKEYNEGLSNTDLMYQRESTIIRKNFSNVSSMLEIQKNSIINEYNKQIFAEKMNLENIKFEYYTACDNIQSKIYRAKYDYETKIIENEIDLKTKIAEHEKQFVSICNSLEIRLLKIEDALTENLARVKLYKTRFDVEKGMLSDAYLSFYNSIKNLVEFENFMHQNICQLSDQIFEENKKQLLITLEYIRQIKLILLSEYNEHEKTIIKTRINFERDLKFKKQLENYKNEKINFDYAINSRKEKLQETISSYQNTIKLFDNNIINLSNQKYILIENLSNSSSTDKKEIKTKIKDINKLIKSNNNQININKENIRELGKTSKKIIKEEKLYNKKYDKKNRIIKKTLENEAKIYTKIINLINSQYYKLRTEINRCGYYTSRHKYTYINSLKNSNKIINMNEKFKTNVKNYFEQHYLKFDNSISREYSLLSDTYNKNFIVNKKEIDKTLLNETKNYNLKLKSINDANNLTLEQFIKNYSSKKKELDFELKETSNKYMNKIKEHNLLIEKINNKLAYEIKCHEDNLNSCTINYKKSLEALKNTYSKTVNQIVTNNQIKNNILENEKKKYDRYIINEKINLETIKKNSISDLNNEFKTFKNKTNGKINIIKENDKINKLKYEKQSKSNVKKFINEQLEIRNEFNKLQEEIEKKCNLRIKSSQKEFRKKIY